MSLGLLRDSLAKFQQAMKEVRSHYLSSVIFAVVCVFFCWGPGLFYTEWLLCYISLCPVPFPLVLIIFLGDLPQCYFFFPLNKCFILATVCL